MGNFFKRASIASGTLLLSAVVLTAQTYRGDSPYSSDPYDRGPAYGERDNPRAYGLELFDRVQSDLGRAAYESYGSRGRIDHAHKEVSDFQRKLSRGRFDKDELDEAIGSVQHVVDSDRISGRARSMLLDDLDRMREFRAARGDYGRDGYRDDYYRR